MRVEQHSTRTAQNGAVPEARVEHSRVSWLLWLIPVAALLFSGWLLYRQFIEKGPTIHIRFQEVNGLDPGNTPVEYRGAKVGKVKKIQLTKNHQGVDVTVELVSTAKALASKGSLFWIVQPEVKVGSIRGLRTLVSGNYLTVIPGNGPPQEDFVGAETPPPAENPNEGLHLTFLAPNLGSVQAQSPIFYKGIQVGEILSYQLANDAQSVVLRARILSPYEPLVRRNSKFWNAGGIHVNLSLFHGAEITAQSPQAIVAGAIEFATPPQPDQPAPDGTAFRLYDKPEEAWKTWAPAISLKAAPVSQSTNRPINPEP